MKRYRATAGAIAAAIIALQAGCATGADGEEVGEFGAGWPELDEREGRAAGPFTAEEVAAIEARLRSFVEEGYVAGLSGLLVKDGEVVSYVDEGLRAADGSTVAPDTIFRIYSMTKPITGVALMTLWEEGAFELDDPVTDYVPAFADLRVLDGTGADGSPRLVPAERPATMRELMSHTAGFAYGLGGTDAANQAFRDQEVMRSPDMQTFIEKVAGIPLLSQPGEDWYYSAAVDVQGYVVEQLSGQRFGEYLEERLFTPLGMDDTAFFVDPDDASRFSAVYGPDPETGRLVPLQSPRFAFTEETVPFESGGGGLVSTIDDYARFCQMLVDGGSLGEARILKPETVELMRTDVLGDLSVNLGGDFSGQQAGAAGFGLDFAVVRDSEAFAGMPVGTYYWGGAAGTWFWIDPVNDLFFIGMIQRFGGERPERSFSAQTAELIYDALED